ncbi:unnamed protein product [Laminaria digitata]
MQNLFRTAHNDVYCTLPRCSRQYRLGWPQDPLMMWVQAALFNLLLARWCFCGAPWVSSCDHRAIDNEETRNSNWTPSRVPWFWTERVSWGRFYSRLMNATGIANVVTAVPMIQEYLLLCFLHGCMAGMSALLLPARTINSTYYVGV